MKSTIDSAGRLVLPKSIREAAGFQGGTEVEIRIAGDHLEIEPVPAEVSLIPKGSFLVAVSAKIRDRKLTTEEVEETRRQIQHEREAAADKK